MRVWKAGLGLTNAQRVLTLALGENLTIAPHSLASSCPFGAESADSPAFFDAQLAGGSAVVRTLPTSGSLWHMRWVGRARSSRRRRPETR